MPRCQTEPGFRLPCSPAAAEPRARPASGGAGPAGLEAVECRVRPASGRAGPAGRAGVPAGIRRPLPLLLLFLLLLALPAQAREILGKVVAIADGDTLTLLDDRRRQRRIRLAGIDTPEAHQPYGRRPGRRWRCWPSAGASGCRCWGWTASAGPSAG